MKLPCPKCNKDIEFEKTSDVPTFPFCSKQCKLIDLGRWLDGTHALPSYSEDVPYELQILEIDEE